MKTSDSIKNIAVALLKSQKEMGAVNKDASNPYYKSNYADINACLEVSVPVLNSNGIVVLQPAYSKDGNHYVETSLIHESGEYIQSDPLKLELTKTDMQQLGSAITYGRRYSLQSLVGLRAVDDDGESAVGRSKAAATPKAQVQALPVVDTVVVRSGPYGSKVEAVSSAATLSASPAESAPRTTFKKSGKKAAESLNGASHAPATQATSASDGLFE